MIRTCVAALRTPFSLLSALSRNCTYTTTQHRPKRATRTDQTRRRRRHRIATSHRGGWEAEPNTVRNNRKRRIKGGQKDESSAALLTSRIASSWWGAKVAVAKVRQRRASNASPPFISSGSDSRSNYTDSVQTNLTEKATCVSLAGPRIRSFFERSSRSPKTYALKPSAVRDKPQTLK